MRRALHIAIGLFAIASQATAAPTANLEQPKATICYGGNAMRLTDSQPISCKGLGKFNSIDELYQAGYRVVSSGVIPEPGSTIYLIVERH